MVYYCYLITNLVNDKKYVGFATDPKQRWREHKRSAASGKGYALHEAIRKYGVQNFTFEVICCGKNKLEMLADVEPILIRQHHSHVTEHGYNLRKELCGANFNSAYGIRDGRFKPRTPEVKAILSEKTKASWEDPAYRDEQSKVRKEYYANGGVHPMQGKNHSPESIRKMSETTKTMVTDEQREQMRLMSLERWNNPKSRQKILEHIQNPSFETRQKMSVAKKGKASWNKGKPNTWTACHRSRTYIVTTPSGEEISVTNLRAYATENGLSQGTLHMTATGQRTSHKGFRARFI